MLKNKWRAEAIQNYLLPVLFGLLSTLIFYTGYGVNDHIEQLPVIIRALDNNFLVNDFFTNVAGDSIARLYYARIIAAVAGSEARLPLTFLLLTLGANIGISVVTYNFARDIFNDSTAGIYASAVVMSVTTFSLGWLPTIYMTALTPSTLAFPFLLAAIWLASRGRIIFAMVLSGLASLIHPLCGLEVGAISLLAFAIFPLLGKQKLTKDHIKSVVVSAVVLLGFALVSIGPQVSQPKIDSRSFIYIVAFFRHPHHYIPSRFGFTQYLYCICFLSAATIIYYRQRETLKRSQSLFGAIVVGIVISLCIGGYLFVEVFPTRIWTTAQTFRLMYIVRWLCLIAVAGAIAGKALPQTTRALTLVSALHPLLLGATMLWQPLRERVEQKYNQASLVFNLSFASLIAVAIIKRWVSISSLSFMTLALYALLIFLWTKLPRKLSCPGVLAVSTFATLILVFPQHLPYIRHSPSIRDSKTLKRIRII